MITILYKRSKLGKIQQWSIIVEGGRFQTHEGFVDGQITASEWTQCKEKNIGNAKGTTIEEQAVKEALAKIQKKKDQGYVETIEEAKSPIERISPMLAHKWEDYKDKLSDKKLACQPKLDGIRCIATQNGLFTRNGKPIVAAPHIWEEVWQLFIGLEDIGLKFDGELYNHELKEDFNTITSIVRKQKLSQEDLNKSKQLLQYHIYDIDVSDRDFVSRMIALKSLIELKDYKYLKVVPTYFYDRESFDLYDLDIMYSEYLEKGYEGQMIRLVESNYENSRSKNLLKRKEFMDEEFEILDIEEGVGNRSGMMGRIKFKMKNGKQFDSNARGTYEYFKELLVNKENYIGKMATVRFQNYTPDGSVRFPVMIDIRNDL